jgi:hypothetical protein
MDQWKYHSKEFDWHTYTLMIWYTWSYISFTFTWIMGLNI